MKTALYLFQSGTLRRKDNSLEFENFQRSESEEEYKLHPGEEIGKEIALEFPLHDDDNFWYGTPRHIPIHRIDSIHTFTNIRLNTALIHFLSKHDINVHFYNYYGGYSSSLLNEWTNTNGVVLKKQVAANSDKYESLFLSKRIILGAAHNMSRLIRYYSNRTGDSNYSDFKLFNHNVMIGAAATIDELLGAEGTIRRRYYHILDGYLLSGLQLEERSYHPPHNAANALLSFLNVLLYSAVLQEVLRTQLNPSIGFLHTAGRQRYPLVYDLTEVFRPLITEQLLVSLIRKRIIKPDDFDTSLGQLAMNDTARYKVVRAFEQRLRTTIKHPVLNRNVSYRYLIRLEVYKIIKHILGEKTYEAFILSW